MYNDLLTHFHIDEDLYTPYSVEIDDVHDSLIYQGFAYDENGEWLPVEKWKYIKKAKGCACDRRRTTATRKRCAPIGEAGQEAVYNDFDFMEWYGFSYLERKVAKELIEGISRRQSKIGRRIREKIIDSIRRKILRHNKT